MGKWIRCFHPAPGAKSRLLCFPHAGGAASAFHPLSAALDGVVETLAVQYPGRHDRFVEPCAERMEDVVTAVLGELPTGRPPALFGHSMGAVLAFETARRLTAEGRPPSVLFLSGREGPGGPLRTGLTRQLGDDELVAEMRLLSGTDDELFNNPDVLQFALPTLRADYRMLFAHEHRPGPPLGCPVVALTGDADPRVTLDGVRAWRAQTTGGFSTHVLAGGHFYLNDHVSEVARLITGALLPEPTARPLG